MKTMICHLSLLLLSTSSSIVESFVIRSPNQIQHPSSPLLGNQHHRITSLKQSLEHNSDSNNVGHNNNDDEEKILSRRNVLQSLTKAVTGAGIAQVITPFTATAQELTQANDISSTSTSSSPSSSTSTTTPKITHRVNFNVRISRADGTFYVRDDPPGTIPTPDNQVYTGTITIGLYGGSYAPNHAAKFLSYVGNGNYDLFEDIPSPLYSRSTFPTFIQGNGLLLGGMIPGLQLTKLNGASALQYRGRISSASLWIDDFSNTPKQSHSGGGLLTHRNLDVLPNFGITTRESKELDASYTVFGEIIPTDSSNAFLRRIIDLPTYSNSKAMSTNGISNNNESPTTSITVGGNGNGNGNTIGGTNSRAAEEVASSVYSFQKDLFRSAAKTFGDTRIDNIYEGKILRRVEVTSVSLDDSTL